LKLSKFYIGSVIWRQLKSCFFILFTIDAEAQYNKNFVDPLGRHYEFHTFDHMTLYVYI